MNSLKVEFFDFFGAVLPGIPAFIIACFIVEDVPFKFSTIGAFLQAITIAQLIGVLIACYCIGFCFHYPAYELFQPLMKKWGDKRTLGLPISFGKREKELTNIRHQSPENFKLISKFFALRQMAYSMFFSLTIFLFFLFLHTKCREFCNRDIVLAFIIASLFAFLFLRRAVDFHERCQKMITNANDLISKKDSDTSMPTPS